MFNVYDTRNGGCNPVIIDESKGEKPPISVESFDISGPEFDDLWDMVTTPRYKMDRSYGDHLDDTQYG